MRRLDSLLSKRAGCDAPGKREGTEPAHSGNTPLRIRFRGDQRSPVIITGCRTNFHAWHWIRQIPAIQRVSACERAGSGVALRSHRTACGFESCSPFTLRVEKDSSTPGVLTLPVAFLPKSGYRSPGALTGSIRRERRRAHIVSRLAKPWCVVSAPLTPETRGRCPNPTERANCTRVRSHIFNAGRFTQFEARHGSC